MAVENTNTKFIYDVVEVEDPKAVERFCWLIVKGIEKPEVVADGDRINCLWTRQTSMVRRFASLAAARWAFYFDYCFDPEESFYRFVKMRYEGNNLVYVEGQKVVVSDDLVRFNLNIAALKEREKQLERLLYIQKKKNKEKEERWRLEDELEEKERRAACQTLAQTANETERVNRGKQKSKDTKGVNEMLAAGGKKKKQAKKTKPKAKNKGAKV